MALPCVRGNESILHCVVHAVHLWDLLRNAERVHQICEACRYQ